MDQTRTDRLHRLAVLGTAATASAVLAWHPVGWLARTWSSPAYGSHGYVFVLLVVALALRSLTSGPANRPSDGQVIPLLLLAAGARLASQVLAINLIGGVALAIDVYALARLMRLDRRPAAVAPLWLGVLFLFALPIETVLQRVVGYPLQLVSAEVACHLLRLSFDEVLCAGVRLQVAGQDVLVDLPCSGAAGVLLLLAGLTALNAVQRPRFGTALLWTGVTLVLALLGNGLRITVLAAGLALGVDTMAEPLHGSVGLMTLALSAVPVLLWYRPSPAPARCQRNRPLRLPRAGQTIAAGLCLVAALWIVTRPGHPVDVSGEVLPRTLPAQVGGALAVPQALAPLEQHYFQRYGGTATKAQYGPLGLGVVNTTSPLRHLHGPETCLRGLGYKVRFLGTRSDGAPTAQYSARGPDGDLWQLRVSFVSPQGQVVPSVGQAVWLWLTGAQGTWTSVQRITPAAMSEAERAALDAAALAALDLPTT